MKMYRIANNIFAYHGTSFSNAKKVISQGILINQSPLKTVNPSNIIKWYGMIPVFLSFDPESLNVGTEAVFKVDISGLPMVADIPSIVDVATKKTVDGVYLESEFISFDEMLNPNSIKCKKSIRWTSSMACMQDIPITRIERIY